MSRLAELKSKIKALRDEATEEGKRLFKEEAKLLFEKHPELDYFTWTQYTPYFNDGDICSFRSGHEYAGVILKSAEEKDVDDWDSNDAGDYTEEKLDEVEASVKSFLSEFDDDDMEAMFGDGYRVTVKADGVEVEEHDHD